MIVTVDAQSSYKAPPTLRLFEQPVNRISGPPAQRNSASDQQLARTYADLVTGQVKMSRVGKPLYVKPVGDLEERRDRSCNEDDNGLFENTKGNQRTIPSAISNQCSEPRGSEQGREVCEVSGTRLHAERGVTFWKFKL